MERCIICDWRPKGKKSTKCHACERYERFGFGPVDTLLKLAKAHIQQREMLLARAAFFYGQPITLDGNLRRVKLRTQNPGKGRGTFGYWCDSCNHPLNTPRCLACSLRGKV
jgi:hypothetical protein